MEENVTVVTSLASMDGYTGRDVWPTATDGSTMIITLEHAVVIGLSWFRQLPKEIAEKMTLVNHTKDENLLQNLEKLVLLGTAKI